LLYKSEQQRECLFGLLGTPALQHDSTTRERNCSVEAEVQTVRNTDVDDDDDADADVRALAELMQDEPEVMQDEAEAVCVRQRPK